MTLKNGDHRIYCSISIRMLCLVEVPHYNCLVFRCGSEELSLLLSSLLLYLGLHSYSPNPVMMTFSQFLDASALVNVQDSDAFVSGA